MKDLYLQCVKHLHSDLHLQCVKHLMLTWCLNQDFHTAGSQHDQLASSATSLQKCYQLHSSVCNVASGILSECFHNLEDSSTAAWAWFQEEVRSAAAHSHAHLVSAGKSRCTGVAAAVTAHNILDSESAALSEWPGVTGSALHWARISGEKMFFGANSAPISGRSAGDSGGQGGMRGVSRGLARSPPESPCCDQTARGASGIFGV
jgi:hypothetical protein